MTDSSTIMPFEFDDQQVRVVIIDDDPWFVAADVAKALGMQGTGAVAMMVKPLDDDEKSTINSVSNVGGPPRVIISKSGLRRIIVRSHGPNAEKFRRLVLGDDVATALPRSNDYAWRDAQRWLTGFVYVVEFSSGVIKVGQTRNGKSRLTAHISTTKMHGVEVQRTWISPRHKMFSENEKYLIQFCKTHGVLAFGREYFTAIAYDDVVQYAETLSYVALTQDDVKAYTVKMEQGINAWKSFMTSQRKSIPIDDDDDDDADDEYSYLNEALLELERDTATYASLKDDLSSGARREFAELLGQSFLGVLGLMEYLGYYDELKRLHESGIFTVNT